MQLKQVFVAGGIPDTTYVSRDHLGLEKQLRSGLQEGHQIIALTGPTKSGKTVLCKRVLSGRESVWVEGGQVDSVEEFWTLAADKLGIPLEISAKDDTGARAGINHFISAERSASESTERRYFPSAKSAVLAECRNRNMCLVVDDFHYMTDTIQKSIIRALKSEILSGLDVIFIAVPHRAFDTIQNEREMEGRFIHIEIPAWEHSELKKIATLGFPALKVEFPDAHAEEFAREAFGSPILMQRFCLRVCLDYEVHSTLEKKKQISPSDAKKREIYASVAKNYGFPTFKILSEGPQSRTDRLPRRLRGSQESVDIYHAILRCIAWTGPKDKLPYDEIREALRNILVDSAMPQKQQITNSLGYMSREARKKISGDPPMEWKDEVLYLTDPSFMFYLRWAFSGKAL